MTITTTKRKAGPYQGDGVTNTFPFDFRVFELQDLCVTYADESGAERILELLVDYGVELNEDQETLPGGNVVLHEVPAIGTRITLTSNMAYLQPTKLTNHGGFYPTVINDSLDRLTIFVQQLEEQVNRAVKVTVSSEGSPDELVASINEGVSAARQSAETAQVCESGSLQNAAMAQNAADRLENGLQDLESVKNGMLPATLDDIQNGTVGKLVDAAGLKCTPNGWQVGDFHLKSFSTCELPFGWYHRNGDRYSVDSPVGQVLKNLSPSFKANHRIVEEDGFINLPTAYHPDGRGYFERAGDVPGVSQDDTMRPITGTCLVLPGWQGKEQTRAYVLQTTSGVFTMVGGNATSNGRFAAASMGLTLARDTLSINSELLGDNYAGGETSPVHISFVPAIYLGV